jgi:indolepyruvate ferredoxin oxidoreductase
MKVDPRFLAAEGPEIFTGNELLVKGALETEGGVHLLGGYPGSPIADFFETLTRIGALLNEKGIRAVINNNEALAAAMLNGSQLVPCRAMIVIKSVGVHVASDALALGNLAGASREGGAIVVYGDDPWSDSTQVPADSRYASKHLHIPVVEPSSAQEVKDFVDLSFKLSAASELFAGFVLTTNLSDGGGSVQCRANQYPALNTLAPRELETKGIDLDKRVLLPPKTWWQEASLGERFTRAKASARRLGMNRIDYPADTRKPIGFASSGLAYGYLLQALSELGLLGASPILKFGMSYPADEQMIRELAKQCERIVVVEERRGFLEEQMRDVVLGDRQSGGAAGSVEVWGKRFPDGLEGLPSIRGLHPSMLISRLAPLIGKKAPAVAAVAAGAMERERKTIEATGRVDVGSLPMRLPTFCSGCPHRDSASVCLEVKKQFMDARYMRRRHHRGVVDLVFHGDTGCYTMLMYPPNTQLMHDYSGMGLGAGTGSGVDPFITNKQVVFMGDSTFFHSGMIAISHAIKTGQDITFIILDNGTTAMTGHQTTPALDYDVLGRATDVQDIEEIARGIASEANVPVVRVNPEHRRRYKRLLEQTFLADGVKVVIATKECGITRMRRKRRRQRATIRARKFLPAAQYMNINQEVCRFCLTCAEMTGCPGLKHAATDYGPRMDTDLTRCVDDGACERVGACCAFERVTVKRARPQRSKVPQLGLDDIPEPQKRATGDLWQCCLTGVGGMGIGLATQILVRAGHKEGFRVTFVDKKGLAIRNGGVVSQIVYNTNETERPTTGIIPFGKADLLLGVDILEAARVLDPQGRVRVASRQKTAAVINTDKVQTTAALLGKEDFSPHRLERVIRENTRGDDYLARNISRICEKYLGSKMYANVMMIGFAFQKGLIPVSMHSIAWAIKDTIRAEWKQNLYAFNMGRKLCERMDLFRGAPRRTGWKETLEEKRRETIRRYRRGQTLADRLCELVAGTIASAADLSESVKRDIVVRAYDCMRWGGIDYARRYVEKVLDVHAKDKRDRGYAATAAVARGLASAMLIKDGIYLAELSTSPEKYARDREKYNVNPANGDRIRYRHMWSWQWRFDRRRLSLRMTTCDWMLKALRSMRWLRAVFPLWHRRDKRYLRSYEQLVADFAFTGYEEYQQQVAKLASRQCMSCRNPACSEVGCPLASRIPDWLELAYMGRWREASDTLHEQNNFPEFTSLVCPAFCESECKRALGDGVVGVREMERQVVERAFAAGWVRPKPAARKSGRSVAVIGSGPAGLAAAQQLARKGHDVTVFERDEQVGGLLRYGIPGHRLDKGLIDRRAEQLRRERVVFRTGADVGRDIPVARLREQFDAVCLCTGASLPHDLAVPGRQQKGVHFALEFLRQTNQQAAGVYVAEDAAIRVRDKVVAVIGAGLTGQDCIEAALASGAREVHQVEILPKEAVNGSQGDSDPAEVTRRYCVSTRAFEGHDGHVTHLECVKVQWQPSADGPVMCEMPGSTFRMKADLALLALGYEPAVDVPIAEQLHLATDEAGRVKVGGYATNVEGVFAAGDLVVGASYVATAIDSARKAAEKIDQYLAKL